MILLYVEDSVDKSTLFIVICQLFFLALISTVRCAVLLCGKIVFGKKKSVSLRLFIVLMVCVYLERVTKIRDGCRVNLLFRGGLVSPTFWKEIYVGKA